MLKPPHGPETWQRNIHIYTTYPKYVQVLWMFLFDVIRIWCSYYHWWPFQICSSHTAIYESDGTSESFILTSRFKEPLVVTQILMIKSHPNSTSSLNSKDQPVYPWDCEFSHFLPCHPNHIKTITNTQSGPVMLLGILCAFSHLTLTQCSEISPILIPSLEMRKPGYTAHNWLFQDHGADKTWLTSRKFKLQSPTQTNINPLASDPSRLHCMDRSSLTGWFSFQELESRAWTVPDFGPRKRDPAYHKVTPVTNLLRDVRVLPSPAIWRSGQAQQDSWV